MPLTEFWSRWWRRQLQRPMGSAPSLRETERQREATARQVAEKLAAIATIPPEPERKPEDSSRNHYVPMRTLRIEMNRGRG